MSSTAVTDRWALRFARPAAVTAVLLSATIYTGVQDPTRPGMFPLCPFYAATGWWCPGCGGLRAVHSLLHGDVALAMHYNVVVVLLLIPLGAVGLGWWWVRSARGLAAIRVPMWFAIGLPALLGLFWVVRNLPSVAPYLTV